MFRPNLTVSQKIAAGYLLISLFSLVAIGFALVNLYLQTEHTQRLVAVEFRAAKLLEELRQTLLAQERLEKQLLVLRDPALRDLLESRRQEFQSRWQQLSQLPLPEEGQDLPKLVTGYLEGDRRCSALLAQRSWRQASRCVQDVSSPQRVDLLKKLETLAGRQEDHFDRSLLSLSAHSTQAYRVTLALAFIGLALSAPVALRLIRSIRRSTGALVLATQQIASGSFDFRLDLPGNDEFSLLARELAETGRKLKDLEQQCLDANPLTRLPGNLVIDREIETRIAQGRPFAHIYVDLDNFKAFGDRYGYKAGSNVIAEVGDLIRRVLRSIGQEDDFVGHIGGDDYVILTGIEQSEPVASQLVVEFDQLVPRFYSEDDRKAGSFVARDRFGIERTFPLMTMSVAVILSTSFATPSPVAISRECAKIKEHLKECPGSNFLINRRQFP